MSRLVILLLLPIGAGALNAQQAGAEIHGSVVSWQTPVLPLADAEVRVSNGQNPPLIAKTGLDGSYRIQNLGIGTYTLKISARKFLDTLIRDVSLTAGEIKQLPVIRLELDPIYDCGTTGRPSYYRPSPGPQNKGAVSGIVLSDRKAAVAQAMVSLVLEGKGRIQSTQTSDDGRFLFSELEPSNRGYYVRVDRGGFFFEEMRAPRVQSGFEAVYAPLTIESCSPGQCKPELKTLRVDPGCA